VWSDRTGEPCRSVWAEENNIIWDFYIVRGERAVVALAQGASEKDPLREDVRGQRRVSRSPWAWETIACARARADRSRHDAAAGPMRYEAPLGCFNEYHLTGDSSFRDFSECLPLAASRTLQHAVSPAA
jgi:hypothetical protein